MVKRNGQRSKISELGGAVYSCPSDAWKCDDAWSVCCAQATQQETPHHLQHCAKGRAATRKRLTAKNFRAQFICLAECFAKESPRQSSLRTRAGSCVCPPLLSFPNILNHMRGFCLFRLRLPKFINGNILMNMMFLASEPTWKCFRSQPCPSRTHRHRPNLWILGIVSRNRVHEIRSRSGADKGAAGQDEPAEEEGGRRIQGAWLG